MLLIILIALPVFTAFTIFLIGKKSNSRKSIEIMALLGVITELLVGLAVVFAPATNTSEWISRYIYVDELGALFLLIVLLLGSFGTMYSVFYLRNEKEARTEEPKKIGNYFALYQLFMLSMIIAVSAYNVLLLWIAVEATTLSSAFLINFFNRPAAIEAAWKYVIINSVALLLCLFGVFLFLAGTEHALPGFTLFDWNNLSHVVHLINPDVLKVAFVFILVGYGTKMGLAPMQNWLPDAHSQAPVPISALLSGGLLNIALLALLRFKGLVDISLGAQFAQTLLLFFGISSMLIAAMLILNQKEYKRMLAYSSIEHMGIIIFGIALGGMATVAALLHALYHSLAKSVLFLSSGNIALSYHSYEIKSVRGMLRTIPVTGILFLGGILAAAGVPPFGTFFTKFTILAVGFELHPILTALALAALALAFVGLMKHASWMLFGENPTEEKQSEAKESFVPIMALFILLLILSLYIPGPLMSLVNNAVLHL
ncbi:MAG: Hydrogenase subunit [Parcubacteria group bacterium GW2011_GWA2_47_7]|nr:MAG: Hydrogenase subunit [Parcubacteria group bacterium GW2011_GWA2_47_7]